jgi:hypothetical protein
MATDPASTTTQMMLLNRIFPDLLNVLPRDTYLSPAIFGAPALPEKAL